MGWAWREQGGRPRAQETACSWLPEAEQLPGVYCSAHTGLTPRLLPWKDLAFLVNTAFLLPGLLGASPVSGTWCVMVARAQVRFLPGLAVTREAWRLSLLLSLPLLSSRPAEGG